MKLKIEHTTRFEYEVPVFETATQVRLQPTDNHGSPQTCSNFTLLVEPATNIFNYVDYFGNSVHYFNILPGHDHLEIKAISTVETGQGRMASHPGEDVTIVEYLSETDYIHFAPEVQKFAAQIEPLADPFLTAEAVCRLINQHLIYEKGVTTVHTTVSEVLALGRGVCQDFAHVMIAVCRLLHIPARYVSGYLYTGSENEYLGGATHAWCEVYGGEERGWLSFDPTHAQLDVGEKHIRIGHGRDYSDVPPVRGTYKGRSKEALSVNVHVMAMEN